MKTRSVLTALFSGLIIGSASAGHGVDCKTCEKKCILVPTTKIIENTCYGYQREDICLPGFSQKGSTHRERVTKSILLCCFRWTDWRPKCARVVHRKKLMKFVVKREVSGFKWVIVPACQCSEGDSTGIKAASVPKPQVANSKVL